MKQQLDKDSKKIYPSPFSFDDAKKELKIKFPGEISGWLLAMESSNKVWWYTYYNTVNQNEVKLSIESRFLRVMLSVSFIHAPEYKMKNSLLTISSFFLYVYPLYYLARIDISKASGLSGYD